MSTSQSPEPVAQRITVPRGQQPLPVRDGLNPSRVRLPQDADATTAWDFLTACIASQRYRAPEDDTEALTQRFATGQVIIGPRFRLAEPESPVAPGEDVWFYRIPAPEREVPFACSIVYEDEYILVANKPPFMATMPRSRHITQTATVRLRRATRNNDLTPAHRLDRLTSGLLLFTKQRQHRGAYQTMFAQRSVRKTYEAVATAAAIPAGTVWESRIEKQHGTIRSYETPGTPNSRTEVVAVTPLDDATQQRLQGYHDTSAALARYTLRPHTGKTHQLRLHMYAAGVPMLGDPFYPEVLPEEAEDFRVPLRLAATELAFTDPVTGAARHFSLPAHAYWPDLKLSSP